MASRYVTITSVEELEALGPTGVVGLYSKPAGDHWWARCHLPRMRYYYLQQGAFTYLLEDDTSEE